MELEFRCSCDLSVCRLHFWFKGVLANRQVVQIGTESLELGRQWFPLMHFAGIDNLLAAPRLQHNKTCLQELKMRCHQTHPPNVGAALVWVHCRFPVPTPHSSRAPKDLNPSICFLHTVGSLIATVGASSCDCQKTCSLFLSDSETLHEKMTLSPWLLLGLMSLW